jgi:DNA polymerase III epsilon subunit-like protein
MIVIDIEASGTDYKKHSIVAIGALDFDNPEHRFYQECRIWEAKDVRGTSLGLTETVCEQCGAKCPVSGQPQLRAHINAESLAISEYTEAQVTDPSKKPEGEVVRMFMEWTQQVADRTLAGQNVSFDRDYLKAACEREGLPWELAHRTIDTHSLCHMHMVKRGLVPPIDAQHRRSALNLDAIMNYCGIPDEPEPHNAMTGALSHAEVISRLLYEKKLLPEFNQFEIPF